MALRIFNKPLNREIRDGKAFFKKLEAFDKLLTNERLVCREPYSSGPSGKIDSMAKEISQEYGALGKKEIESKRNLLQTRIDVKANLKTAKIVGGGILLVLAGGTALILKESFALIGKVAVGAGFVIAAARVMISGAFRWAPREAGEYMEIIRSAVERNSKVQSRQYGPKV